jgi:hypothetical protein
VPDAVAAALVKGSITITSDPTGDETFRSLQDEAKSACDSSSIGKSLSKSNTSLLIRDDKAELAELRIVDSTLFAHVNLTEIDALAKAGGVDDFSASLDEGAESLGPQAATALADIRAGKWLKLPLSSYVKDLEDALASEEPAPASPRACDFSSLASKVVEAVKPHVTVTDANDSSEDRVLDVKVQVASALKALVTTLQKDDTLPFGSLFQDEDPADISKDIRPGTANGTIRLHDGHLAGVTLDLESVRQLSTDPGVDSFAGAQLAVDVDDSADAVSAPTELSSVDLKQLFEDLLGGFFGMAMSEAGMTSSSEFSYGG